MANWSEFRALMPVARNWAYFDHAAVAPLPAPTRQALASWVNAVSNEGDVHWPAWAARANQARVHAATLLNCSPAEIALAPNTTAGISTVAEGLAWLPGDNVVTLANEFPSNQYPWLNLASRGVETRQVPVEEGRVDLARIEAACDARTRLVAVSWVGYASGWRIDPAAVAEIAHRRGALFLLDAIQGLGVFPLDLAAAPVDFLAADGHKWLLGPEGAGLLYVRREHLDKLRPSCVGWNSVAQGSDYSRIELTLKEDASRFEGGTLNYGGFVGLAASLELLLGFGAGPRSTTLADRVLSLTDHAAERLLALGASIADRGPRENRSGILSFDLPGRDPKQVRQQCLAAGVVLSVRGGRLRIALHGYNHEADVERLLAALGQ